LLRNWGEGHGREQFSFSRLLGRTHPEHGREICNLLDCGTRRDVLARAIAR
jgi:hypothetical protein